SARCGTVRIADDPANQVDSGPYGLLLGNDGAHFQEALRGFGDKRRAVGQPSRCVAQGLCLRGRLRGLLMTLMADRNDGQHDESADSATTRRQCRKVTTPTPEAAEETARTDRAHG